MKAELRKEKRLKARYGAMASFFPPNPDFSLVIGKLIDISSRGFALQYYAKGSPHSVSSHLEIFGIYRPLIHIDRIPGTIVYDYEVNEGTRSVLKERRCGVQFGELSNDQRSRLDYFLENYATL